MKNLFAGLLVSIIAATGCVTDDGDADGATPTLITTASEEEAMAELDTLLPVSVDESVVERGAWCSSNSTSGICCFAGPDGEIVCVVW